MTKRFGIITTIQPPTDCVRTLSQRLRESGMGLVVIGDKKGPDAYPVENVRFYSLTDQLASDFDLARRLPTGHYARKNVGYLAAIAEGAETLYETDDDNAPTDAWRLREREVEALRVEKKGWVNVYRCFTRENIWPRGFPLDEIRSDGLTADRRPPISDLGTQPSDLRSPTSGLRPQPSDLRYLPAPIQQGLADNSPDVDAIWRLTLDRPFRFDPGLSVYLSPGAWCPFNSQNTWWWPEAFPLLYLPSCCSFRMTDIWRGFIAQRCLWALGQGLVFHGADVWQDRNRHDLMKDFEAEIPGYRGNKKIIAALAGLDLDSGKENTGGNLLRCYEALSAEGFFPKQELELVETWLDDLSKL